MRKPQDDVFARIEKHRQLQIEYEECPMNVLLPSQYTRKAKRESDKISRTLDAVTWSFVDQPPQTAAGAAALLRYADEHLASGRMWPNNRRYHDNGPDMDWVHAIIRAVGNALVA
jgi:hypothetical protein